MHELLSNITDLSILIFEYIGVFVIVVAGIVGIAGYIRRDPLTRLKLAKGLAMGLEFKLGSEILRTVVLREVSEILIVGSIILLRAALTFLIHWEIKNEESTHAKENGALHESIAGEGVTKESAAKKGTTKMRALLRAHKPSGDA